MFVANHIDANNAVRPFDNEQDTLISSYEGMIFGKRINSNDASLMIRRIDWTINTVYDIYDHRDPHLYDNNFYVIVNEGTQWNVFKCLENGNGNPSTIAPSILNVGSSGEDFFYPTDGYRWKYLYTIDSATEDKFATTDYFPVKSDTNTVSNAIPGSLSVITVTSPGRGYNNYFNGEFGVGDIRLNGDPKKYGISTSGINTTNNYYDGCWLYISSGSGAGQYRLVNSYVSNSTHNFVILDEEFDPADLPQNGSIFELSPSVSIVGDGREVSPASARAIIDSSSNSVSRIEMIDKGVGYFYAAAEVQASSVVGVTSMAGVVPIISPVKGHGSDPASELGARYVGVTVKLIGNEGNTIITDNDYSQIGILRNPLFNEVEVTLTNQNKDFFTNEVVYKIKTKQLEGTVQTTLDANNNLTDTLSVFGVDGTAIADNGSTILINYGSNYQLANVISVTSSTIQMDANAIWNTGNSNFANVHLATINGSALVDGFAVGSVVLTNVTSNFESGDKLIGSLTGVYGEANTVTINGESKTFDTFMQTYEYVGSMTEGTFALDEVVYQGDSQTANARFDSIEPDANTSTSRIFVTNQFGVFNVDPSLGDNQLRGSMSGAIATLTAKYLPDLVYGSGDIVYIEYGDSVTRAEENTETFKLVFSF
jgi:hypothetical protein